MTTPLTWSRRTVLAATPALAVAGKSAFAAEPTDARTYHAPLLGRPEAKKRFILWGSFTCAFTALLTLTLEQIVRDMPDKASLEWRHFPVNPPDPALHVASQAFSGSNFWTFGIGLQRFIYANNGKFEYLRAPSILELARRAGGTQEDLDRAYADSSKRKVVRDDLLAGQLLGIERTPALFYDGYFMTPAGLPLDLKAFDLSLRNMLRNA